MAFNPDEYLAQKAGGDSFDPEEYLREKGKTQQKNLGFRITATPPLQELSLADLRAMREAEERGKRGEGESEDGTKSVVTKFPPPREQFIREAGPDDRPVFGVKGVSVEPELRGKTMRDEGVIRPYSSKDLPVSQRIGRSAAGAAGEMLSGAGQGAQLFGRAAEKASLGYKAISEEVGDSGALNLIAKFYEGAGKASKGLGKAVAPVGRAFAEKMAYEDPEFLDKSISAIASSATFLVPGIGIMKGAQALNLAPKIANALGIASSALLESSIEAGMAREDALNRGLSQDQADSVGYKVFTANLPITVFGNKLGVFAKSNNLIGKFAKSMIGEGTQEALQQVPQNVVAGKEMGYGTGEAALYGAIAAGPFGVLESVAERQAPPAAEPMPTLPLSPNLDETAKSRALQMAQTDPVAAMKSVTPSQAWPQIEEMARSFAEAAEADESIPAEQKRTAVQSALNEMLNMNLSPAPVPGAVVEGVQQEMPAPEVQQDPQQAFMKTQMEVIRKVAEKAGLKGGQVAQLVADRVRGGEVRTLVTDGVTAGKTADQMADEFLAQYEGEQVETPTPAPQAETVPQGQPEAAGEAIAGRWSELVPDREAQGGQAVAAIDMTEDEAKAVIIKTADGRYTVRSEVVDVVSQNDEDGLYFDSIAEAKEAVERALPEPGKTPLQLPAEQAIPMIQAVPGAGNPSIPEAKLAYEAAKEQARAEGEPVFEGDMIPQDEAFTPPAAPDNPGLMAYEQASQKFPGLTQDQHKALVRGAMAANLPVPEEVVNQYPDMAAEAKVEASALFQGPIKSDIQEQLEAVGRPAEEAAADAEIVAAYVQAEAARRGMTPEQFYSEKRRIMVESGAVEPGELTQEGADEQPMWAEELQSVGGKIDPDGTVLVWHATTKEKGEQILKDGFLRRPADAPDSYGVYVGTGDNYKYLGQSYGDGTLIPIRIKATDLNIEDVGPGRLITFYAKTKGGVYRPTAIGEKALIPPTLEQPAYHGSPYEFDKFTLDHIGKGEGAQAYGWGLYFAGNKEVAEYYREELSKYSTEPPQRLFKGEKLTPGTPEYHGATLVSALGKSLPGVKKEVSGWISNAKPGEDVEHYKKVLAFLETATSKKDFTEKPPQGKLYEVNIPEDDVLLDWDKPINQQSETVKEAVAKALNPEIKLRPISKELTDVMYDDSSLGAFPTEKAAEVKENWINYYPVEGAFLYRELTRRVSGNKENYGRGPEAASKYLNSLGIKGIKYLDQQSRGKGEGSYNYVIFDDSAIEILNRYYQGPRASINVLAHKIRLGEFADSSSFIHEAAHDFLQDMSDYVAEGKASEDYLKFWEPVKSWLDLKDGKITRDQHEKFARGFEAFMREGKAPSSTLERVFRTFRDWLLKIYKTVTDLNVDLNDSMRQFFGDMLTAQEAELKALTQEAKAATPESVTTLEQGPAPGFYNPRAYDKVIGKLEPGALLTARGRIEAPGVKGKAIPRATVVKLISVDPKTGQAIVDFKGQPVFTRLDMFRETYQKPEQIGPIPGIPVKRAVERATGLNPAQQQIVTTESKALRAKLATEEKAARTAAKFTKAQILERIGDEKSDGKAIQKSAVEYVKMTVPKSSQGRFINLLNKATTKSGLGQVVVLADKESDIAYRKGLTEDIKKVSSRALESMRVEVNYREAVRDLLAEFDLQKRRPETILKLKALQDYIQDMESRGQEVFLPDEMYKRLEILALRPIEKISNGELENALRDLYILEAVGKEAQGQKELAQAIERGEILRELTAAATPIENLNSETQKMSKVWNKFQESYWALSPMMVFHDRMDGGKGTHDGPHAKIGEKMNGSFFKFLELRRRYILPVQELIKKHELSDDNLNRIGIYAFKVQKNGVARVLASMPEVTEEYVKALTLTSQEMEVYQKMREGMEAIYPEVKRIMGKLYNKSVGKIDHYFSMQLDWDKLMDAEVKDRMAFTDEEFAGWRKNISAGMTKTRQALAKSPIKINAMQVFLQHINDASYLVSMQEDVKKYSEIVNTTEYAEAAGPIGYKIMKGWLDIIARQGKAGGASKIWIIDELTTNMGAATLGFKLSTFLIQSTALMDISALVGGSEVMNGVGQIVSDAKIREWSLETFPKLRERLGGDIAYREFSSVKWLAKWQELGYAPLKMLDGLVASSAVVAAYNKKAAELGAPAAGEGPLNAEAVKFANFALDRTQASPFFLDAGVAFSSPDFLTGNVSLNKAILKFKQFPVNRWFYMSYDLPRLKTGAEKLNAGLWMASAAAAEMGVRVSSTSIMLSAIGAVGWGIASGVKRADWDDDWWLDYALTVMEMCPFVAEPMSIVRYGSTPAPAFDNIAKLAINSSQAVHAQNKYRKTVALRKALQALATMIGFSGTAQLGQVIGWAYNPKTLTFPYNEEYRELVDAGGQRTRGEQQRLNELHKSKAQFAVQARIYRSAMERGDTEMAAKAARKAAEAMEGL